MSNILSVNLREKNIDNFLDTIANESVYFTFSKPTTWSNDNLPDTPVDSTNINDNIFSDLLYAKKIVASNSSKVIKNYGYVSGARYQKFDPDTSIDDLTSILTFIPATATANLTSGSITSVTMNLNGLGYKTIPNVSVDSGTAVLIASISDGSVIEITVVDGGTYVTAPNIIIDPPSNISSSVFDLRPFYVITDEMKVYKCLDNNSGAVSTVKPISVISSSAYPSVLADGYVWKYMFTVSTANLDKFYTSNWIPVTTLLADNGTDQWDVQFNAGKTTLKGNIGSTGINSQSYIGVADNSFMEPGDVLLVGPEQLLIDGSTGFIGSTGISVFRGYNYSTIGATGSGMAVQDITTHHGSDPEDELNADNIMIKVRVAENEGGQIIDSGSYRQIGLVSNPVYFKSFFYVGATGSPTNNEMCLNTSHDYSDTTKLWYPSIGKYIIILSGTGAGQTRKISAFNSGVVTISEPWTVIPSTDSLYGIVANATILNQTLVLQINTMNGGSEFNQGSTVTQDVTNASGIVVEQDTTLNLLYLTNCSGSFNTNNNVSSGTISAIIQGIYTLPSLVPNIGKVLYLENRKPIVRYSDQIEDVKVIITF